LVMPWLPSPPAAGSSSRRVTSIGLIAVTPSNLSATASASAAAFTAAAALAANSLAA